MLDKLKKLLLLHEGLRLMPYLDTVNKLSIGIGRNLTDCGISVEEAEFMLDNDVKAHIGFLDRYLPWWRNLDEVRQMVLADMCFNLGIDSLLGFHHFLQSLEKHRYDEAATEMMLSKWATQVGGRAKRLEQMMRTGREVS